MTGHFLNVLLDILMTGLLLATIIYCLRLNKRIVLLQDSRSELARIIREFDECTTRATQNINELHTATTRISENIQLKIDKANYLANDLDMLIARANKLSGKNEPAPARPSPTQPARVPEAPAAARPEVSDASAPRRPQRMRSRAEQELISLLGGKKTTSSGE